MPRHDGVSWGWKQSGRSFRVPKPHSDPSLLSIYANSTVSVQVAAGLSLSEDALFRRHNEDMRVNI